MEQGFGGDGQAAVFHDPKLLDAANIDITVKMFRHNLLIDMMGIFAAR